MWIKVNQNLVTSRIKAFGNFSHHPEDMEVSAEHRLYYKQCPIDYKVDVRDGVTKDADCLRLNLYFDPTKRSEQLMQLDIDIKQQGDALESIKNDKIHMDDDATIKRLYNYYDIKLNDADRTIVSYELNAKKVEQAKLISGFFANVTHATDMSAILALESYALRDEQEKCFGQEKGSLGYDRQRCWSEDGKNGRLFITFVAMILNSYTKYIWKTKLKKLFLSSTNAVLDEMRPIRIIEHTGHARKMTAFVGKQLDICKAFGFEVPDECSLVYKSKRAKTGKRGRPRKVKVVSEARESVDSTNKS